MFFTLSIKRLATLAALLCVGGFLIKGARPVPTSNRWASAYGRMQAPRSSACSVLLADGRVLITGGAGGEGTLSSAEFFGADGRFVAAAPMLEPRSSHACALLPDGAVMVAGGRTNGGITNSVEIFDPVQNSWRPGPSLLVARAGAAVVTLIDKRILIAGGATSTGASDSLEIYDSESGEFAIAAGRLTLPRLGHAAALLDDGRVLIAGGSDGDRALADIDLFDPADNRISSAGKMSYARADLTATTLLGGRVLLLGGSNGKAEIGVAEVFDAKTGETTAEPALMGAARRDHIAIRIPHNNTILIAGGTSSGQALAYTEIYAPWRHAFQSAGDLEGGKTAATGIALKRSGGVLLAGGSTAGVAQAGAQTIGLPTIMTDKEDYSPGTPVHFTGSGWIPGVAVTISMTESPFIDQPVDIVTMADAAGNISDSSFAPDINDVGIKFYVTATQPGPLDASGKPTVLTAQTSFTDARNLNLTFAGTGAGSVTISVSSGTVKAPVACGGTNTELASQTVTGTCTPNISTNDNNATVTFQANPASGSTFAGWSSQSNFNSSCSTNPCSSILSGNSALTVTFNLTVATATTTTVSSSGSPSTYGNAVSLTSTISPSAATGSVQFLIDGVNFGSPVTVSGGSATSSSTSSLAAGTHSVTATFAGTGSYTNSSGTLSGGQVVNPKAASVTPNTASKTYGDLDPAFTGTLSGFLPADGVTASYGRTTGETVAGSPSTISATLSPAAVLGNYTITSNTANFTITQKAASVTPNSATKVYGSADPAFSGTLSGFLPADNVTATYSRTAGESVGGSSYSISATLSPAAVLGNYNITSNTAPFTITPKTVTASVTANGKVYDGTNTTTIATCTVNALVSGDSVTCSAAAATFDSVNQGSRTVTATGITLDGPAVGNYNLSPTTATATATISKRDTSVTPDAKSKTYGDADPALTGTLTNFVAGDSITATYSRTAGETVGGSPYTISATLSPAGKLDNYTITYNTANLTITQKAASVTPNSANKVYGSADPAFSGTLSGFLPADNVTATYSRTAGESVGGSSYSISATLSPAAVLGNYSITSNTAAFTITPKTVTASVTANGKVYDGTNTTTIATCTVSGLVSGDSMTCSAAAATFDSVNQGSRTVTATGITLVGGAATNYNLSPTTATATATISKRDTSVTPDAKSKTYGDADPALTGTLTNFVAGDSITATYSRTAGETVGGSPYTISATLSPAGKLDNYTITYNTANLTITQKAASVTPNSANKVYGSADPAFSGTLSGFLLADNVTATYSRTAGESVGGSPYAISATLSPAAVLGNYSITSNTAAFTITPKTVTASVTANGKVYDGTNTTTIATCTVNGLVSGDSMTCSAASATFDSVNAGPHTVTATGITLVGGAATNYNLNPTTATAMATISKRDASVTPNATSKTYGDVDPTLTGTLTNFVAGDSITATYSRTAGENVGGSPYPISATLTPVPALNNYTITYNTANFTITQKAASVTPNSASKVYGSADPAFSGTLSGFLSADNVTATYSRIGGGSVAGSPYAISATLSPAAVLGNYSITSNTAAFTITPKTVTASVTANGKVYDGTNTTTIATCTVNDLVSGDSVACSAAAATFDSVNQGPHTVTATGITLVGGAATNYNLSPTTATATATISKRDASVTPNATSKTYGDANPTLTGTLTNFVAGDSITAVYSRTAGENVGGSPYTISATLTPVPALGNYTITYNTASFMITARPVTVTADFKTKVYGTSDPVLTYHITSGSLAFTDVFSGGLSRTSGESAGSYAINQGTLALTSNYALTYVGANFVISQAPTTTAIVSSLSTSSTSPLKATFTATVASWNNQATGTVTFKEGATTLGTFNLASGMSTFTTSALTTGSHVITATYSGDQNFSGSSSPSNSAPTNVTITAPASGSVFSVTQAVSFAGTFTDTAGKSHTAGWSFDGSSSTTGTVTNESSVTGSYTFPTGVWGVSLAVNDKVGGIAVSDSIGGLPTMVVVYDPNGGFVTGGGWINSPLGAYVTDSSLIGKANFGFVSKYQKGATIPTGETEFQFKVGNLNFHSTVYEWLVVSGPKAQYKGSGTINGTGNYGFLLTATDGDINGGGGVDKFRIKIVEKASGAIVYDNVPNGSDDIDNANPLAIGGGSIVIHK